MFTKSPNFNNAPINFMSLALMIMFIGLGLNKSKAQDCNTIMVCNDLVQVSLNANCTETVTAAMILENEIYPDSFYTVVTTTSNGSVILGNILNRNHIGRTLNVRVTLNNCDLSCNGSIFVEDKLPPVISNCPSVTVNCGQSTAPGSVPRPTVADACGGTVTLTNTDREVISQCTAPFVKVITRNWVATDQYGNKSTCTQTINVNRPTISNVTFPRNYDDIDLPSLECGGIYARLPNGAPDPSVTGRPGGADCANIMFYYTDVVFTICGSSLKVLRQWTVLDWCTGKDTLVGQVIKVIDKQAPICISPPDFLFDISTDEGKCTGTFTVPRPTVAFECSNWDYTVGYKLRKPNGSPFDNPVFDNVRRINRPDGSYYYTISNLPTDTSWIVYFITDACGNSSMCFTEVVVRDKESPSPVCEGFTVVTIDDAGVAELKANSVDDGSSDNCGIDRFKVKRLTNNCARPQDLEFSDYVVFCCNDIRPAPNEYERVVLRVFDKAGNFSDCVGNVKVQDKRGPTITKVPDVTISCTQDYRNLAVTGGRPTAKDNCTVRIDSIDNVSLRCGVGRVTRTWRATDPQGLVATSTQIITIVDFTPFVASNITWPRDLEINGCTRADANPNLINSYPTFVNVDCADIAVSYEDDLFAAPGACSKILRTWRVVDWCSADPQNPVFFTHVQKITLKNSVAPTIVSGCDNRTITTNNNECQAYVEHNIVATDDCTPASELKYSWAYDENNNGTIDARGNGNLYGRVYPAGVHKFIFTVTDNCENKKECSYLFTIRENKAPTPLCHANIVWVIDEKGEAEVWASDFDLKSFDDCNGPLTFSFNEAGTQPARVFTCADIPNGVQSTIPLRMYVFDRFGNREFCNVVLTLQDSPNKNKCPNTSLTGNLSGKVTNKLAAGFNELELELFNKANSNIMKSMTNSNGEYNFKDVEIGNEYVLKPIKLDDILNGVSTLDLVLIQRHILGTKNIENPYDLIAADINKDKKISTTDLVQLRKVILGIDSKFNSNNPWRFIPSDHVFADPKNPHEFKDAIEVKVNENSNKYDFTSIKVGDVNNSATYNFRGENVENRSTPLTLVGEKINYKAGEQYSVELKASDDIQISGLQMAIEFDNSVLKLESIENKELGITKEHYNVIGNTILISASLTQNKAILTGDGIIKLNFTAVNNGSENAIELSQKAFANEIYDEHYQARSLNIEWLNQKTTVSEKVAVVPNPFSGQTQIVFNSKENAEAIFKIVDATGREIYSRVEEVSKGKNSININKNQLGGKAGIYFYQLTIDGLQSNGALILTD